MATAKKLPSGRWRVRVSEKDENGRYTTKSFTADTKKEAEYAAAEYQFGRRTLEKDGNITLRAACLEYIESKCNVLSPSTIKGYYVIVRNRLGTIMDMKIKDIDQLTIQKAINADSRNLSPKTMRNTHGFLCAVLSMFRPDINLNTRLPQKTKTEIIIPETDDILYIIKTIEDKKLLKAVLLAAFGSCRRSEICALNVSDIYGNTIHISKSMVLDHHNNYITKQTTKSDAGNRVITLPEEVIKRLDAADETGSIVGLNPNALCHRYRRHLERIGSKHFRFHDLRHYQASILHALGIPDRYIMERGGWGTDSTLKAVYQHTMSEKRKNVEEEICDFFSEKFSEVIG